MVGELAFGSHAHSRESVMLTIDLREVFQGDRVEVWVDGQRVRDEHDVRTRLQIGKARSLQIALPRDPSLVEIRLPQTGRSAAVEIDSRRTPHLAVDLSADGQLTLTPSQEPFRYA